MRKLNAEVHEQLWTKYWERTHLPLLHSSLPIVRFFSKFLYFVVTLPQRWQYI